MVDFLSLINAPPYLENIRNLTEMVKDIVKCVFDH